LSEIVRIDTHFSEALFVTAGDLSALIVKESLA